MMKLPLDEIIRLKMRLDEERCQLNGLRKDYFETYRKQLENYMRDCHERERKIAALEIELARLQRRKGMEEKAYNDEKDTHGQKAIY